MTIPVGDTTPLPEGRTDVPEGSPDLRGVDLAEPTPAVLDRASELDEFGTDAAIDDEVQWADELAADHPVRFWQAINPPTPAMLSLAVALIASVFVFLQLRPDLLFSDTTPSGGDMGAHVWGPAFMRDNLLSQGRLTGWTPDWYAGFPAYHFYMVVPALAVLAVNAGLTPLLGVPLAAVVLFGARRLASRYANRALIWSTAGLLAVLLVGLPYGMSFKLVSVAGLVTFPVAAWAMGRLSKCPEPVPGLLALGALLFLFDTNFTIYGGNIASTLAGEFAFSLSLSLSLVAIGMAMRALDSGSYRAASAVVIALVALSHIIPLFFLVAALIIAVLLDERIPRPWILAAGITLALVPLGMNSGSNLATTIAALLSFVIVVVAVVFSDRNVQRRAQWLLVVGPVAALLSGFWLLPFYLRSPYFNDMGWERLEAVGPALLTTPMKVLLPVAVIGAVLAFAVRDRMGMLFAVLAALSASGVANLPEGKLWNARLLPFYYLSVYLLAAVGIALVVRFSAAAVSERLDRPDPRTMTAAPIAILLVALVAVSVPLRLLPLATTDESGRYSWFGIRSNEASFLPSWISWNYSGYEEKRSYREYRDIVSVMAALGETNGCGRAMWEYEKDLDRYGTPMALMLLPHWTDGCIGSMEGLYFESSATTPFHFLHQSTLSFAPSRAQRDLPYKNFDLDVGVAQLQVMGVRYYMAQSDEATAAAVQHPDLIQVGESQPWSVFEVAQSDLVVGLDYEPVVTAGPDLALAGVAASRFDVGWVSQAVTFYNDPLAYQSLPAEDGPSEWARISTLLPTDGRPLSPPEVRDIDIGSDTIAFTVDEVGQPVLVKTSYFPNWDVDGADGPWRIGPNLMVVVPTEKSVKLSYGYTAPDILGYLATLAGLAGLVALAVNDRRRRLVHEQIREPEPEVLSPEPQVLMPEPPED